MNITFYNYTNEEIRVNKSPYLNGSITKDCDLKENTSMLTPNITINLPVSSFVNCNYAYIPAFNLYYFVRDKIAVTGNITTISLAVDPLMSCKNAILNSKQLVYRNENYDNSSKWQIDSSFNMSSVPEVETKLFNGGKTPFSDNLSLDEYNVVLITQGHGYETVEEGDE